LNIELKTLRKMIKNNNVDSSKLLENELNNYKSKIKNSEFICIFDIEFTDKFATNISEIGFIIIDNTEYKLNKRQLILEKRHFIIEEQIDMYTRPNTPIEHKYMFAYGDSEIVSLGDSLDYLNTAFNGSDTILVFSDMNKKEQFEEYDFNIRDFLSIQDMLCLKFNKCNNISLSNAMDLYTENNQPINNAGNDCISSLEILKSNFNDVFCEIDIKIINDFSNDPRKKSNQNLRESRALNKKTLING
jgi:hypothetical protein